MKKKAYFATAEELERLGPEAIPPQMISGKHLIYSSPATLAFNSPGAEGFGVKRAGLAVPDSIMLIVAPGCCGRNTSLISSMPEYNDRFFYLMMDETDIVTGRHLKKIPKAVKEICDCCEKKPSVVMICITCVDALLGTDMERVCRKAEEKVDIPVRPCYMYALTREGRKPPMVHVRQSLYSLLEPQKKKGNVVNLLGFFSPLVDDCELYDLLHQAGVKTIHEISRCKDYEEYRTMSQANFNLVLHPVFLGISYVCAFVYSVKLNGKRAVIFNLCLIPLIFLYAAWYSYYNHFGVTNLRQNFIGNQIPWNLWYMELSAEPPWQQ